MTALATEIQSPQAPDGKRLHVTLQSRSVPQGGVLLVHGLGEYGGRYDHVVHAWTELGLAVVRFDLRGHGRSDGIRGHVSDYGRHLDDVSLIAGLARQRFPEIPWVLFGHSLGGGIVANWALRRLRDEHRVGGVVLSSPWLVLSRRRPAWEVLSIRLLSAFWPWFPLPAYFRVQDLCRDPHAIELYRSDPHIHHRITARLAIQAYDAGYWAIEHAPELRLPVLGIHGGQDRLTSPEGTRLFCERAPHGEFYYYEDMVHETHNDPRWRDVVDRVGHWIMQQLQGQTSSKSLACVEAEP